MTDNVPENTVARAAARAIDGIHHLADSSPPPTTDSICPRTRCKGNVQLRQALSMAIDRTRLVGASPSGRRPPSVSCRRARGTTTSQSWPWRNLGDDANEWRKPSVSMPERDTRRACRCTYACSITAIPRSSVPPSSWPRCGGRPSESIPKSRTRNIASFCRSRHDQVPLGCGCALHGRPTSTMPATSSILYGCTRATTTPAT